jgi:hypothetical protein
MLRENPFQLELQFGVNLNKAKNVGLGGFLLNEIKKLIVNLGMPNVKKDDPH